MTAVEWIFEELENKENGFPHLTLEQIYKQAKEMEKQQIQNAFYRGIQQQQERAWFIFKTEPEDYYNETFKNK